MKFVLTLYLCSIITGQCNSHFTVGFEFDDHYECAATGYELAAKTIEKIDRETVNEGRLAVKFYCQEVDLNIIIPPKKPGKPT
jgi:hypothetical protein